MNSKRIVSIKGTGRETNFEFHSNIFESIVNTVSENKLVVISTFGDKRVGKSFLLNYIIRFLTSTREDAWLDDHNPETGLSGFAWSENDPETNRGIWLSSYPITVICSDGETVDILLIDTKGTFNADEETSKKELEIFTATCVQISSFVIFNVAEKISSEVLKKLSENVIANQSKIKRSNTNIPYFIFCVRDVQATLPSKSGYEYLKKALNSPGEFGRVLAANLSNNDCVLLPFPGEMIQRRRYNGNAACLEQSFKKVLQEFISTTFNADCLATLAISPQNYISKFKLLSKAYGVQPFRGNSRSQPQPQSQPNPAGKPPIQGEPAVLRQPVQAAASASLPTASISENSPNYKFYIESFTQFTTNLTKAFEDPSATEVVLQDSFERFQNEACEYFADQDVQGDFQSIRAEEDQLAGDMTAYFKAGIFNWKCKQEQIQNDIEAVLQQAIVSYTEDMENFCKNHNQSGPNFKRHHETFRQQAKDYFEAETSKYPPHLVRPHVQTLNEEIQDKFASFQEQLDEQKKLREEARIEFAEVAAFQIYKSHMQNELKKFSFLKSEEFERLHERVLRDAIREFRKHVSFESFDKIESLSAQIGLQFKIHKEKNDSIEARVQQEISDISYDLMREYNQDVENLMLNPRITLLGFQNDHDNLILIIQAKFLSHENDENACILSENWEKFSDSINKKFQASVEEVKEIVSARRAKIEEDSKQLAELIFNSFKIMTSDEALRRLDQAQVAKLCTEGKNEQLEKFRVGTADYDEDIRAKYLEKLEAQIDSECTDVLDRFRLLTLESQLHLKEAILNAKEYYDSEMVKKFLPSTKFYKPAELLGIHLKIFAEIRTRFCTKLFPPQISEVKDSLDPIFQVYERKNNMNTPNTSIAIGIDLGTTYSCVAVYHDGEVKVLEDENGKRMMPSYVAFINGQDVAINGQEVVGHAAKSMAYQFPKNTVYDVKRIIAKDFNDPILQEDMKNWAFQIINEDGSPRIQIPDVPQLQTPEGISAKILRTLKNMAGKYLKTEIRDVVITVPAYFNDGQRNATRDAGELAGLNVLSIINEPTAAALAYFWENKQAGPINVLVYDLGGGTFDVSVLTMQNDNVEVLATGGSGHLGGQDFDNAIIDYCFEEFQKTTGVNLSAYKTSQNAIERERYATNRSLLKNIVEDVKISLSSTDSRPAIREALHKNLDLNVPITRENFNKINQARFDETLRIVEETLNQSGLSKKDINEVILVGGSSKILKVKEMLSEFFNKDIINHNVNPDEAVAKGAAIQAAILSGNHEQRVKNISLQDVTPLTLGLGIQNDVFSKIIPRNTRVPVSKTEKFYKKPNQKNITLKIYEGEEALASHNHFLGTYNINGLQETAEDEEIMVTMSINSENILRVSAEGAGISRKFVVQKKGRLTEEEKRRYLDGEEL